MKREIKICDGSFLYTGAKAAGMNLGINKNYEPMNFRWKHIHDPSQINSDEDLWFTDSWLWTVDQFKARRKIAWLIEPPSLANSAEIVRKNPHFDYVLTHQNVPDWLWYPLAFSLVKPEDWGIFPKYKLCSIVVSGKNFLEGHKLRHEAVAVVKAMNLDVDVMGNGYGAQVNKIQGHRDYAFSIVIENESSQWYFTEKIIDCFGQGCIPIYWGCGGEIGKYFNKDGIIEFKTIPELVKILETLSPEKYQAMLPSARENYRTATKYFCVENAIFNLYPHLFA